MNTPTFLISRCYAETTPESVEDGDTSDTGHVYENEELTAQELADEISRGGFSREGATDWLTTGWHTEDYTTGTDREETLHFSRDNPPRLRKHWERVIAICAARLRKHWEMMATRNAA